MTIKPIRLKKAAHRVLFSASLCLFVLLFACGETDPDGRPTPADQQPPAESAQLGGVYRAPLMQSPATLDPAYVRDLYGESVVHQLFEGLVQFGPYLTVLPSLAESWQVDDSGRKIRFFIRKEARFHSGRPVTAEDARFSLTRLLRIDPPPAILPHLLKVEGAIAYRSGQSDRVSGLQCPGQHELQIRLVEPHAPLLSALAMYQAFIVPPEVVESGQTIFNKNPIGTGPFQFVDWESNRVIRLKRFDLHFAGSAFLDEIQFNLYPGSPIDTVLTDFKAGKLEEMPYYIGIGENLPGDKAYQRVQRPSLSLFFYGVNNRHPLLKQPDIRRALSLAIDRKAITGSVYKDQFEAAHSILPPGMPAYQRLDELIQFDPALARQILQKTAAAATAGPLALEIASGSTSDFAKKELEMIRQSWRPLGIELKTKFIPDWEQFERYIQSESVQLYRYAWNADLPDPDSFLHPLFASDSPVNYSRYTDPKTDRMIVEALGIVDPVKRAKKYQEIERYILSQYPILPMFYLSIDRVYQPYVQKLHISALGAHTMVLNRVWLNKKTSATGAAD